MGFLQILGFVLFCTCPGNLDYLLEINQSRGNMGLAGACLDIYYKRNACYVSFTIFIISIIANHWETASGMVFAYCSGRFLYSVLKWMPFLINQEAEEDPYYGA
jgi:hypothetical protein